MKWYKISVSYDGTDYYGWQVQKDLPTIASVMQQTFFRVFKKKIILRGASRTDAGVHALGHVSFFSTELICSSRDMQHAWNNALPNAIHITSLELVAYNGHPHANIDHKVYWYQLFLQRPSPLITRYGWHIRDTVNVGKLKDTLQLFVGTHNFRNFCDSEVTGSTVRTIISVDLQPVPEYTALRIVITGHSFLRYMVRRMVGAAISVARQDKLSQQDIIDALASDGVCKQFMCAPSSGLLLHSIVYKE